MVKPKKLGMIGALIPLAVGIIGKSKPHLFFNLPFPLSILCWTVTGNPMPPHSMKDAWHEDEIDSWTRDGDVVVAVGAKCGTTMMQYCTHQIRTRGKDVNDELFPDVNLAAPSMDLRHSRAGSWAEQKPRYNTTVLPNGQLWKDVWDNPAFPFRIFKSHYAPDVLPVRKKGGNKIKYIAMTRNGIDVAASLTKFFASLSPNFRRLWGGFPPLISSELSKDGTHPLVTQLLPGGRSEPTYFGYVKSWWSHRHDPNVLLLHYADLRRDLKSNVKIIADFLEVPLSENELDIVTQRCGIQHMKKLKDKFNAKMPLNMDGPKLWDLEHDTIVQEGKLVGKGEVGKGASKFSDELVAKWKKAEEDYFGHDPELLRWAREGGGYS